MGWIKDKTKRISYLRFFVQISFLVVIFCLAIIAVSKGLILIVILGSTFFLGRLFCGWICPFGLYMDIITLLRRLLRIRYWSLPEKLNKNLHLLSYVIALVILISPLFMVSGSLLSIDDFVGFRGSFRYLSILLAPLETLITPFRPPFGALLDLGWLNIGFPYFRAVSFPYVGEIMASMGGKGFALPIAVMFVLLIVIATFKVRRFWCRFCPTGISIAVINRLKQFRWVPFLHLKKEEEKCTKCGICKRVCPVQVTEVFEKKGGDIHTSICTFCLRCVEMCPYQDCLKVCVGKKVLFKSRNWLN